MIYITAIHLSGGTKHEHIERVRWEDPSTNETGESTKQVIVRWLEENKQNEARVRSGASYVRVGVVKATPPYIRTYANDTWTDNLLALPRF
ncbi:DUF3892 domain-containing protein [Streptomyces sp. DSM 40484]|uniref:DUF3892 domain-containing protein n=1 Tax=Streptomyces kroppenstedtii TaxID=3051181 RepID=UPI0028CFF7CD|nr:DUF3892 domain-containing protein [Streptomyces sp. DSM 40484]